MKIEFFGGRTSISLWDLAIAVGGELCGMDDGRSVFVRGICTDSRETEEGIMFCALKGERTDGHNYIEPLIAKGMRLFLCRRDTDVSAGSCYLVKVEDTEKALGDLARRFGCGDDSVTVGITGSVGKTTTKEFVSSVLDNTFKTHKTEGNFNSSIGMPLVIMSAPRDTQMCILEMGMGNKGDISYLSSIAQPSVAIITNIGHAHIEALGSRENIRDAKLEIVDGMRDGGTLVLNGDDDMLSGYSSERLRVIRVSLRSKVADVFARNIKRLPDGSSFDIVDNVRGKELCGVKINVTGEHNIYGALFAYVVGGIVMSVSDESIINGLFAFENVGMRQRATNVGGLTLIEDCYNAGPESMAAAIANLKGACDISGQKGIAVLGDMLELGDMSEHLHRQVGHRCAECSPEYLVLFGEQARFIGRGAVEAGYPEDRVLFFGADDRSEIARKILVLAGEGDVILFKASRGMRAEEISEAIRKMKDDVKEK